MITAPDYRFILILGFFEAALGAVASPMTEQVFPQWVRCVAFALALGIAAVVKLMVVLSRRSPSPLDPEIASTVSRSAPPLTIVKGGGSA